jgi:hypothetical protein
MIPVEDARSRILGTFGRLPAEQIAISQAAGRVLAQDVISRITKPPHPVSAMDGYAVRAADVAEVPVTLQVVGEAPAGGAYNAALKPGEAVRIFTGGPVPEGADSIVIQENTERDGNSVTVTVSVSQGRYVRRQGLDFSAGDAGPPAGRKLGPREIGLIAAMNVPWLKVTRKPRVTVLGTGDEIVMPGESLGPNQIISSNSLALAAIIADAGGEPLSLGIVRDDEEALRSARFWPRKASPSISGRSPCDPANLSPSGGWETFRFWDFRAIRSQRWFAAICFCVPRSLRCWARLEMNWMRMSQRSERTWAATMNVRIMSAPGSNGPEMVVSRQRLSTARTARCLPRFRRRAA